MASTRRVAISALLLLPLVFCVAGHGVETGPSTTELLGRIEALEKQGEQQKRRTDRQDEYIDELKSVIHNLNEHIGDQKSLIASLQTTVNAQQRSIANLQEHVEAIKNPADVKAEVDVGTEPDDTVSEKVNYANAKNQKRDISKAFGRPGRLVLPSDAVAFLVRMDRVLAHLGKNQNVRYDTIVTNIGGGYHKDHGLFIASVPGIYIFSTSVLADVKPHNWIEVDLEKNGGFLASAYAYADSTHDQGSVTVVTQVAAGDEVWVRVRLPQTDADVSGYGFSTFMGCLILPLEV